MKLASYDIDRFFLVDGEERHKESPENFWIPEKRIRENLEEGMLAKVIFNMIEESSTKSTCIERMWVEINDIQGEFYIGKLCNEPRSNVSIKYGQDVCFQAKHVIDADVQNT